GAREENRGEKREPGEEITLAPPLNEREGGKIESEQTTERKGREKSKTKQKDKDTGRWERKQEWQTKEGERLSYLAGSTRHRERERERERQRDMRALISLTGNW